MWNRTHITKFQYLSTIGKIKQHSPGRNFTWRIFNSDGNFRLSFGERDFFATNPYFGNYQRQKKNYRWYSIAFGQIFWYLREVLARIARWFRFGRRQNSESKRIEWYQTDENQCSLNFVGKKHWLFETKKTKTINSSSVFQILIQFTLNLNSFHHTVFAFGFLQFLNWNHQECISWSWIGIIGLISILHFSSFVRFPIGV